MINSKIGSAFVVMLLVCCASLVLAGGGDTSSYTAGNHSSPSTGGSTAAIMMDSSADCQGYVICITHDGSVVTLDSIGITGTAASAAGAEFVVANEYANSGTLGVVLDFNSPFDGQTIAAGSGIHIANFNYSCNNAVFYTEGDPAPPTVTSALTFEDNNDNNPPLENVTVSGGLSVYPSITDGSCSCEPMEIPAEDTELWAEAQDFPEEAHTG
ncbi:MAG: hypothetical protein HRU16_05340, partial [Planctomycetes bacterium]|nr:hypothetical protein [Planctomycetota bacterium]